MKIERQAIDMSEMLNPRGRLARDLEMTARRASWLSLMCAHWLAFKGDNAEAARRDEPTYNLPKFFRDSERFNLARKKSGAYERSRSKRATPSWADRWDWAWVFNYWYSGGLDGAVKNLMEMLPSENVKAIERELLL